MTINEFQNSESESKLKTFIQLTTGYQISQAINVAAKLGIADLLTEEAKSVDELAQATDSHARSLYRLLRTLARVGIFTEVEPLRFSLTPLAEYLRSDHPDSLRHLVMLHCDDWQWRSWGELFDTIKDGKPGVYHAYQVNNLFEYFKQDAQAEEIYNKAMLNVSRNYHERFIEGYDFSSASTIIDVGGGEGQLISSILKANPHLHGILFDRSQVVAEGQKLLEREGVANRCKTVDGDMFKSVPAGGDIYMLAHILIDWDDDNAVTILTNIRRVINDKVRLLVIDSIFDPTDKYQWNVGLDLLSMIWESGQVRTKAELSQLFQKTGFRVERILPTKTPVSLIELVPEYNT